MLRYHTVEYDGYTYKKLEEKGEKERGAGSRYLLEVLQGTKDEQEELKRIIGKISKRNKWKDLSDKQEKVYMKMEKILGKLRQYTPFSVPFLNKVSKREAPEYYSRIQTPMDLSKIGKKIAAQEYLDVGEFAEDLELIWRNCFEFNNEHGNIYTMYAQKMKERVAVLLQDLYSEREVEVQGAAEEVAHLLATEKTRKEFAVSRTAVLQRASEFVSRRSGQRMGDFWIKEQAAAREVPRELGRTLAEVLAAPLEKSQDKPHIPEYSWFYNSFPVVTEPEPQGPELPLDLLLSPVHEKYRGIRKNLGHIPSQGQGQGQGQGQDPTGPLHHAKLVETGGRVGGSVSGSVSGASEGVGIGADIEAGMGCCLTKIEVALVLKKIIALELLSIGFTAVESSALNILVTHTLFQLDKVLAEVIRYQAAEAQKPAEQQHARAVVQALIEKYRVKSTDFTPVPFFSDEEDASEEEDILDLMYSDAEEIEPLDTIL